MELKVKINSYQMEWFEQAKARLDRGLPVDHGTLATIGEIVLNSLDDLGDLDI